ncbi:hypothetical protein EFP84_18800 [Leptospira kmetyi]|uniref:Uncharacterized protein n=1 Tax=Leptospira kmetyi TaxID=408139 RepID=A0AAD0USK8_9LEPT|nr:hypothetical protein [Leptospira kmetyi]AYV57692.1 hypothetical protein EFP84_18800 [Leptospira kmetyi]
MSNDSSQPEDKIHDEIESFRGVPSTTEPSDESNIYERGNIQAISLNELKNNEVAIKQLMNSYNIARKDLKKLNDVISDQKSDIEYLKTSPFISVFSLCINVISILVATLGVNKITTNAEDKFGLALVILGGVGLVLSGALPILFPYAKDFFNKSKNSA